ncbi:MAG: hypothetical protein QNI84_03215 [Henriciella sp.]|nr:hypothetical protein [Henriciella sp.]
MARLGRILIGRGGLGRLVLLTWFGVYPILTLVAWGLNPLLIAMPIWLQTLIMSALMVPLMVLGVMPMLRRWM